MRRLAMDRPAFLQQDIDPQETREWLDALDAVLDAEGPERAHFLLESLVDKARRSGTNLPYTPTTAYINTIPPHAEDLLPGDQEMEHRIRSLIRWNAVATVLRANKESSELGGHIASFQSAATLYDVGFDLPHQVYTPVRFSRAALQKNRWRTSAARSTARVFPPTHIHGSCPIFGSLRRYRWDLVRCRRSTKHAS